MRKFKVTGTVTITIEKEVYAASEGRAIDKAEDELSYLTEYMNGTVGTDVDNVELMADAEIQWNDAELIEDDSDFECPDCGCECEQKTDIEGEVFWHCSNCEEWWDDEGENLGPYFELEEDDEDNED